MDSLSSYTLNLLKTVADGAVVLRLGQGETRSLPARTGGFALRLEAVDGAVWLTAESSKEDWVLTAGERWDCGGAACGRVVLQALAPAIVVVSRL